MIRRFSLRQAAIRLLVAAGAIVAMSGRAPGGDITFTNETGDKGTGFGTVNTLVTYHQNGTEWGSVKWNGSADVFTGNGSGANNGGIVDTNGNNGSNTVTSGALRTGSLVTPDSDGGATLALIFNIGQQGQDSKLLLHGFTLYFFNSSGGLLSGITDSNTPNAGPGTLSYVTSETALAGSGTGTSGWLFNVHLTAAEAQAFFGSSFGTSGTTFVDTNRIGFEITKDGALTQAIGNTNDGQDTFYLTSTQGIAAVPEPATTATAISGLAALGLARLRRRANRSTLA